MIAIFPELVTMARSADVEKLAVMARRYYGREDTFRPQCDLERLLRNAGIRVERFANGSQGALLAKDEQGRFVIVSMIDPELEATAARFMLAHQLGHYLLDIQPLIAQGDWQVSGYRESNSPSQRYAAGDSLPPRQQLDARREARADAFAAALLMPIGMVRKAYERLKDSERLAQFFGVTRAVMERRLEQLGLVHSHMPRNFLDAEARMTAAGFHEPAASEVTVEQLAQAAPLLAPPSMPRSFAAASYGRTDKRTRGMARSEATQTELVTAALIEQPAEATPQASNRAHRLAGTSFETPPSTMVESQADAPTGFKAEGSADGVASIPPPQAPLASAQRPSLGMARIRELAQRLENERLKRRGEQSIG